MAIRIITGGNFVNYGARSMLFCVVESLQQKYPNDTIVLTDLFPLLSDEEKKQYNFTIVNMHVRSLFRISFPILKLLFKSSIKSDDEKTIEKYLKEAVAIYDISGYGISSHNQALLWTVATLLPMRRAKKQGIPFYILPQSLGPFNYTGLKKLLLFPFVKKYLKAAKYIFAREQEGKECINAFRHENVMLSPDIVLQWSGNNLGKLHNIKSSIQHIEVPQNSVALVPNKQIFKILGKDNTVNLFTRIGNKVIEKGYQLIIIKHSEDDKELCNNIANKLNNNMVHVIDNNLMPDEIIQLFEKMEAVISARYHGLVHALRCNSPVFSLGWAIKYKQLMHLYNLDEFHLSLEKDFTNDELLERVENLLDKKSGLSDNIKQINAKIQSDSIFIKYL